MIFFLSFFGCCCCCYLTTDYVTVKSHSTSSTARTSFNAHDVVGVKDFQNEFPNNNANEETDGDDDDEEDDESTTGHDVRAMKF